MDNAEWRDTQRAQNVARYEEEQKKEDDEHAKNSKRDKDFLA